MEQKGKREEEVYLQILHLQIRPPGLVTCIATLPGFVQLALSVGIDLVSSSARVTSVKSQQGLGLSDGQPDPKIGPQVYLGPIKSHKAMDIFRMGVGGSPIPKSKCKNIGKILTFW